MSLPPVPIEYDSDNGETVDNASDDEPLSQAMEALSPNSIAALRESLRDAVAALAVISTLTPNEVEQLSGPYLTIRTRLDPLINTPTTPSKASRQTSSAVKKKKEKDEDSAQSAAEFAEEIKKEVEHCSLVSDHLSFKERAATLAKSIQMSIESMQMEPTPKLQTIDACDTELNKAFVVLKSVKKLLLAIRIHCGFLWVRQQEIAMETFARGEKLQVIVNGTMDFITDLTKYKKHQQEKYNTHKSDLSRCIALARISRTFPEIVNTEKPWSWFRKALTNDKLATAIDALQGAAE